MRLKQYPTRKQRPRYVFRRDYLPEPQQYFSEQGLQLKGAGNWKSALCPFHQDSSPSLRIHISTGGFRCMACGARGSDVLAFHMQHYNLPFIDAVKELGAWIPSK